MLSKEENEIYSRQICLSEIGVEGQLKLKNSRVLVIGAGGLGCPVLQYLSAAGVGTIGIVDFDTVDKSNLQRQILFSYSSQGKNKATEAKKRLLENNPFVSIQTYTAGIHANNAIELLENYDIVVDCSDNYDTRYLINDACVLLDKPLVYAAIYKFEGQVSVFNFNNGPTYRCLYPKAPKSASIANCASTGVIGVLPGIIGTLQANEVLKMILEIGTTLSGKLLQYNALSNDFHTFALAKSEEDLYSELLQSKTLNSADYNTPSCSQNDGVVQEISQEEFDSICLDDIQLIDVRELDEKPRLLNLNALQIPLGEIEMRVNEIDREKRTVVFCQSGIRSKKAIELLQTKYEFGELLNLKNGVGALYEIVGLH